MKRLLLVMWMMVGCAFGAKDASALRILGFQDNNGYEHASMPEAKALLERLGQENGWEVVSSRDSSCLTELDLSTFDVVVFNNNCGNKGPVMKPAEQVALQDYVRNGGGFLGVHTAGALWKEGGDFQTWYEGLIGARQVKHPKVQRARLVVEDRTHPATRHLPEEWFVTDEWHIFDRNPREKVNVLISLDESSYKGKADQKMGGDHPFVWYHEYDGGRSFFTSLGHTAAIYSNPDFEKLIKGAILWTSGQVEAKAKKKSPVPVSTTQLPVSKGLFIDLDAGAGVELEDGKRVKAWHNQVRENGVDVFVKQDKGRKVAGSGRPTLKKNVAAIGGKSTLVFKEQELVNMDEDAADHLVTGSGYTWFSVMSVYKQHVGKKDVNSFFGNLRNGAPYDGFWGNLMDDNNVWMGTRNGFKSTSKGKKKVNSNGKGTPGLWDDQLNPCVQTTKPLVENRYYLVMGRMGAGTDVVGLELFVNSAPPVDRKPVPVNPKANPSKMAVGQERDATNHPGKESFHGEIARFLIFDRPLSDEELAAMSRHLMDQYQLGLEEPATGGLIGHWPLDGDFKDASGNGYDGTVSEDPLEFSEGKHGKAADFRGASIINCGNVPLGTKGQLTVAVWVKPNRVEQAFAGFVQKQNTDYSERSFWMGQHPRDGYFAWAQFTPPTAKGTQLKTSKAVLANGEWTHVALTMDGTYQRIYVNGMLETTSEKRDSGIMDGGDNLRFGRVENTPGGRYSGLMDDIWIFDAALSESEIRSLMKDENLKVDSTEFPYYTYTNRQDAAFDSTEAVRRQVESAEALGMSVVETIGLSEDVSLEMRICPAGEFPLGSPASEKGREKDEPLKRGVFPHPFYLSTYPLTQEQYQAVMKALPTGTDVLKPGYTARVSYAQTREELIPAMQPYAHKGWRIELVTMDQMEYATRAGTLETWYTGNKQAELKNAAWTKANSGGKEHPVGQKQPNAWGFHDTLGNVWQWVTGFSDERDNFPGAMHVVKGGGFDSPAGKNGCRSANVMVQKIPSGVRVAMVKISEEKLPSTAEQ